MYLSFNWIIHYIIRVLHLRHQLEAYFKNIWIMTCIMEAFKANLRISKNDKKYNESFCNISNFSQSLASGSKTKKKKGCGVTSASMNSSNNFFLQMVYVTYYHWYVFTAHTRVHQLIWSCCCKESEVFFGKNWRKIENK